MSICRPKQPCFSNPCTTRSCRIGFAFALANTACLRAGCGGSEDPVGSAPTGTTLITPITLIKQITHHHATRDERLLAACGA